MARDIWLDDFPGLSRQVFSNKSRIAWKREPAIIVLHSTEGSDYPSAATYKNGNSAPHLTTNPRKKTARQHYSFGVGAWALKAPSGISTNSMGAIQIEIIGSCVRGNGLPSIFDFDEDSKNYLAALLKRISDETGIPLQSTVEWIEYPASYGNTGVRLSSAAFNNYTGILGHQHVPGNTHGDPGNLDVADLIRRATGNAPLPVPTPVSPTAPAQKSTVIIAPGIPAPPFPLPSGWYFGPKSGPVKSVSGFYSYRGALRMWQQRMKDRGWNIDPDGLYGDQTRSVCISFQEEKGLLVDGRIGPQTWGAAWTAPITREQ